MGRQTVYYTPTYLAPTYATPTAFVPTVGPSTVVPTAYYAPTTAYYGSTVSPLSGSISSFYGTGNVYPSFPGSGTFAPTTSSYGVLPVSSFSSPTTAYYLSSSYAAPVYSTGYAYPVVPAYQPGGLFDGLRRMFRPTWNWGSGYVTRFYPAQVTYYSPVTSYSPVTGVPVTSLSPCTSYQPQMQRLPISSYLPATVAPAQASCGNPTGYYVPSSPGVSTYPQTSTGVYPPGGAANDFAPVGQPVLPPTNVQYPSIMPPSSSYEPSSSSNLPSTSSSTSLYPSSTAPNYTPSLGTNATSSSSFTPLTDASSGSSAGAVLGESRLQPIPAPSLPSWYSSSPRDESPEDTRSFKTIQWRNPVSPLPATQPALPAKKPFVKFDDSGWK